MLPNCVRVYMYECIHVHLCMCLRACIVEPMIGHMCVSCVYMYVLGDSMQACIVSQNVHLYVCMHMYLLV